MAVRHFLGTQGVVRKISNRIELAPLLESMVLSFPEEFASHFHDLSLALSLNTCFSSWISLSFSRNLEKLRIMNL
jgi:hypothetical protein